MFYHLLLDLSSVFTVVTNFKCFLSQTNYFEVTKFEFAVSTEIISVGLWRINELIISSSKFIKFILTSTKITTAS